MKETLWFFMKSSGLGHSYSKELCTINQILRKFQLIVIYIYKLIYIFSLINDLF